LYSNLDIQSSDKSVVKVERNPLDSIIATSKNVNSLEFGITLNGYKTGNAQVSISCKDGHKVVYNVTVLPEEYAKDFVFTTGKITGVDGLSAKVAIDGKSYDVTDDLDLSKIQTLYNERPDETVIAKFENGHISSLDAVEDVINPTVSVVPDTKSVVYQNKGYDTSEIGFTLRLGCSLSAPYNAYKGEIESVSYQANDVKFSVVGKGLKFGKKSTKNETLDVSIHPGETKELSYTVDVDSKYAPAYVNSEVDICAEVSTSIGDKSGFGVVNFENLDKQQSNISTTTAQKTAQKNAQKQIADGNGITFAMDSTISEYFNKTEIDEIEYALSAWFSSIMAVEKIVKDDDSAFMQEVKKRCGLTTDDIMNKIFAKMGIDKSIKAITIGSRYTAKTTVRVKDKKGHKTDIDFTVYFTDYAYYEQSAYASFGYFTYTFKDCKGKEHNPLANGVVTYTDLDGFISSTQTLLESNLKSWYYKYWGKDANKTVEMLSSDLVNKLLNTNGSFSDHIFNLVSSPAKKWWKVTNSCPNDVYIYNSAGELSASIVDNEVVSGDEDICIFTDGDVKYFYLMGDDYLVRYIGNDSGTMNVKLEAYEDGNLVRTISYDDIALEEGKEYEAVVTEGLYLDTEVYNLESDTAAEESVSDTKEKVVSSIAFITSGDINGDDAINISDLMLVLNHVSGKKTLTGDDFDAGDVNVDSKVDLQDLMKILNYVSGKSKEL
jgi:hypothetical protein